MAAAAFVGNMVLQYQDGFRESIPLTFSDVNAAQAVWPDAGTDGNISGAHGNALLVDLQLSAAGTDTRTSTINVNSKRIPESVLNGANVGTVVNRQFQQVPLKLPSGAKLQFNQVT